MKNILNEKPIETLHGRLLASVNFVSDCDIKNRKVLDIGCGYGWCELNFLRRKVRQMTGMETTEEDLKTARENVKNRKIHFCVGTTTKLPFPDECFNTVVSWEVIEHIPKNSELLMFKEVYRVLKPGGRFYLSTPNKSFFACVLDPAWWLIGHRHYSQGQLTKYAQKNEFEVANVKIIGKWWTLLSILDMYFSKWVLKKHPLYESIFAKKTTEEYIKNDGFVNIFMEYKK